MAISLAFALYAQMLLSETLFVTLLLAGFLALAIWVDERRTMNDREGIGHRRHSVWSFVLRHRSLIMAGGLFGLATLTRSLTLAFLPLVALGVAGIGNAAPRGSWRR